VADYVLSAVSDHVRCADCKGTGLRVPFDPKSGPCPSCLARGYRVIRRRFILPLGSRQAPREVPHELG
jgi:DnaJ-class molecular chaperone